MRARGDNHHPLLSTVLNVRECTKAGRFALQTIVFLISSEANPREPKGRTHSTRSVLRLEFPPHWHSYASCALCRPGGNVRSSAACAANARGHECKNGHKKGSTEGGIFAINERHVNMLNVRRPNQLAYSVLISVILFGITQFLLTYRNLAEIEDEKMTLHERLVAQEHAHQNAQMELQNAKRDVHRLMRRVQEAEKWQKAAQKRSQTFAIDTVNSKKLCSCECISVSVCAGAHQMRTIAVQSQNAFF